MTAEVGSIVCPNCGAASDEPCAEWCAAADPRFPNRTQKLGDRARTMTEGSSILPANSDSSLLGGVQAPSVTTLDVEY